MEWGQELTCASTPYFYTLTQPSSLFLLSLVVVVLVSRKQGRHLSFYYHRGRPSIFRVDQKRKTRYWYHCSSCISPPTALPLNFSSVRVASSNIIDIISHDSRVFPWI